MVNCEYAGGAVVCPPPPPPPKRDYRLLYPYCAVCRAGCGGSGACSGSVGNGTTACCYAQSQDDLLARPTCPPLLD